MTLIEYEKLGSYGNYSMLVKDLGLTDLFEEVWNESLEEYELNISEYEVIRKVLEAAPDDYVLQVDDAELAYEVLQIQ